MSGLHYKKDGSLDMRYSSSKAAVASGGSSYGGGSSSYGGGSASYGGGSSSYGGGSSSYGGGSSSYGGGSSSYGGGSSSYGGIHSSTSSYGSSSSHSSYSSPASSDLHYKKDGSLDMRYASSRPATASGSRGSYTPSPAASSGYSSSGNDSLHYKKDGSLDMRYSSSKQATTSGNHNLSPAASSGYSSSGNDSLHYKKDGSLDMRYSSSKQANASSGNTASPAASSRLPSHQPASVGKSSGELHYKKDGSLDMRYRSSKSAIDAVTGELDKIKLKPAAKKLSVLNIPDYVPTKADGTPDMRTRAAKDWVATQAANWQGNGVPSWVPQDKFGAINMQSAVGCAFARACPPKPNISDRGQYWSNRLLDEDFFDSVAEERQEPVMLPPRPPVLPDPVPLKYEQASSFSASEDDNPAPIPEGASLIDYQQLVFEQDKEEKAVLGRGSFGVVLKAKLYGVDADVDDAGIRANVKRNGIDVAVKKLHLEQLTTKEKRTFRKELIILAHLGSHPNLVKLYAYCLNPPCLVMELVKMGSLTHLLHYCEDPKIEAKITDGRVKKKIIFGIANGMLQLHTAKVIHGDLKPQNVLITETYEAKLADFGLAYFRGKTSSTVASKKMETDDKESREEIGGTAGYMAPELLDSVSPPEFSSDVYSFGIVLNEVISEEEPFSDQYANFAARGPFGAANYAKQGMRPTMDANTPDIVKRLITSCWAANATLRPTFKDIVAAIEAPKFVIPNSF